MLDLHEIIENHQGSALAQFEREVAQLTQEQLEQLNVEIGIYASGRVRGIHRDFLEISAAEVYWPNYFTAYLKIMGKPSALDVNT